MKRWTKWIPLGIAVIVIGLGSFLYTHFIVRISMPAELQTEAEQALAAGITIEDAQNDFAEMGPKPAGSREKPNNPNAYPLAFDDIRSVSFGADDDYVYFKIEFWGNFPDKPPEFGNDRVISTSVKVSFTNSLGEEQVIWHLGSGYLPVIDLPNLDTYYSFGPTGIREPEDARFSGRASDSRISGGAGTNYLLGVLPLAKSGLALGQQSYLSVSVETSSRVYDHAAVDVLCGQGKMPALISWVPGTDTFQVMDDFYTP